MSSYVVEGAKLSCSMGNKDSTFKVPMDHKIYINDKPQGNIMDYKPNVNILPFGKCKSLSNPTVAAATSANNGVLRPMPCMPVVATPWMNGKMDVLIENFPAMLKTSKNMCAWCGVITIKDDGQ